MLRVTLDKLEFNSIREFEDVELSFKKGINFIQIRNGYGKSTTLQILRWMFTGTTPETSDDYPLYLRDESVSNHQETNKGHVVLHMTIESGGEINPWRLWLYFDKNEGRSWFETESPAIGGHENGWMLPSEFKSKFFNKPNFTELFMFDGETAADLSKTQDHDQIVQSIREITSLRTIYLHTNDNGYLDTDRMEYFAQEGITNLDNSYGKWMAWSHELMVHKIKIEESYKPKAERKIQELEQDIAANEAKKKELGEQTDASKQLKKLENSLKKRRKELNDLTSDLLIALGDPTNMTHLWSKVKSWNTNLLVRKLPEGVGRVFFMDMVKADTCICGREMNQDAIEEINTRGEKYLSDGILTVVNSMQAEVDESNSVPDYLEELKQAILDKQYEIIGIQEDVKALTSDFDEDLQAQITSLTNQIRDDTKEIATLREELQEFIETDPTIISENGWDTEIFGSNNNIMIQPARFKKCMNLFSLRKVEREINSKLAVAGPLAQIHTATDLMKEVFADALSNVMKQTHKSLENDTQNIFDKIPGKGGDKTIKLEDNGFKFYDSNSGKQGGINMGAMLAAAYSFAGAMSKLGSVEISMVCDSPVTGMDPMTIGGWSDEIWDLFEQMIFLITPGERRNIESVPDENNKTFERLYSKNVQRVTLHRENENEKGTPQSGRMIVNTDDNWFSSYGAKRAQ
tara:strand:+ start:3646 stop:5712 length:2067 start_codon:yes stop_codon:yes gene_type:complete